MPSLAEQIDFIVGVDTHKHTHTAAVVTPTGGVVAHLTVAADEGGYERAVAFAREHACRAQQLHPPNGGHGRRSSRRVGLGGCGVRLFGPPGGAPPGLARSAACALPSPRGRWGRGAQPSRSGAGARHRDCPHSQKRNPPGRVRPRAVGTRPGGPPARGGRRCRQNQFRHRGAPPGGPNKLTPQPSSPRASSWWPERRQFRARRPALGKRVRSALCLRDADGRLVARDVLGPHRGSTGRRRSVEESARNDRSTVPE
jgi:hypothetical protein